MNSSNVKRLIGVFTILILVCSVGYGVFSSQKRKQQELRERQLAEERLAEERLAESFFSMLSSKLTLLDQQVNIKKYQTLVADVATMPKSIIDSITVIDNYEDELKKINLEYSQKQRSLVTQLSISYFPRSDLAVTPSGATIQFLNPPRYPEGAQNFKTQEYWHLTPMIENGAVSLLEYVAIPVLIPGRIGAQKQQAIINEEMKEILNKKNELKNQNSKAMKYLIAVDLASKLIDLHKFSQVHFQIIKETENSKEVEALSKEFYQKLLSHGENLENYQSFSNNLFRKFEISYKTLPSSQTVKEAIDNALRFFHRCKGTSEKNLAANVIGFIDHPDKVQWVEPVTGMEFVWVPGGCFQMGSGTNHDIVHEVCLDGFWIGRYEVTQAQWEKIMGINTIQNKKGGRYPIHSVSWNDAKLFVSELNQKSHDKFMLPTEAQWEYAAKSAGKIQDVDRKNLDWFAIFQDNADTKGPHQVGEKVPNELGIYDMLGNVTEWCEDAFSFDGYQIHKTKNPVITYSSLNGKYDYWISKKHMAHRGGNWDSVFYSLSTTRRSHSFFKDKNNRIGIRLVRQD